MLEHYLDRLTYIRNLFAKESQILKEIDASILTYDLPIHIKPEEGKFLQFLIKMIDAKKVIELGTLAGYSTIWMAEMLPKQGKIYTIEHDDKRYKLATDNFKKYSDSDKIVALKGKAIEVLNQLSEQAPFDMIFIDADKPSYNLYLDWAENNIRQNGLIIGDDTFLTGAVYLENLPQKIKTSTKDLMHKFNERLADSSKYFSIMLANERGLTIAQKLF